MPGLGYAAAWAMPADLTLQILRDKAHLEEARRRRADKPARPKEDVTSFRGPGGTRTYRVNNMAGLASALSMPPHPPPPRP